MNEKETHECTACCPTCYACIFDMVDQQKEWVGLTDKELEEFSEAKLGSYDLCLEVEAKLKEKNGL